MDIISGKPEFKNEVPVKYALGRGDTLVCYGDSEFKEYEPEYKIQKESKAFHTVIVKHNDNGFIRMQDLCFFCKHEKPRRKCNNSIFRRYCAIRKKDVVTWHYNKSGCGYFKRI